MRACVRACSHTYVYVRVASLTPSLGPDAEGGRRGTVLLHGALQVVHGQILQVTGRLDEGGVRHQIGEGCNRQ